jgi:hypothetical protein
MRSRQLPPGGEEIGMYESLKVAELRNGQP